MNRTFSLDSSNKGDSYRCWIKADSEKDAIKQARAIVREKLGLNLSSLVYQKIDGASMGRICDYHMWDPKSGFSRARFAQLHEIFG